MRTVGIKRVEAFDVQEVNAHLSGPDVVVTGEFVGGLVITLDDDRAIYLGDRDGYGPLRVWLTNRDDAEGENVEVEFVVYPKLGQEEEV